MNNLRQSCTQCREYVQSCTVVNFIENGEELVWTDLKQYQLAMSAQAQGPSNFKERSCQEY